MKEATGELNMTVITLVAVAAVGLLFYFVIWPLVQNMVVSQTCKTYGSDFRAVRGEEYDDANSGNATTYYWKCCPGGVEGDDCVDLEGSKTTTNTGTETE